MLYKVFEICCKAAEGRRKPLDFSRNLMKF
jgi:hypothetical protein